MNDKKTLMLTALLFVVAGSVKAQIPGFSLGVKAGFNYSTLPTSYAIVADKKGVAGFNAGLFARLGNKVFVQPEATVSTTGGKFSVLGGDNTRSALTAKFTQLDIPVMLGYRFLDLSIVKFRGMIGPDFNFNLSKPSSLINIGNATNTYNWKSNAVNGVVDLGIDVVNVTLDARYNIGFTKINEGLGERLNYFNLSVGFKFL